MRCVDFLTFCSIWKCYIVHVENVGNKIIFIAKVILYFKIRLFHSILQEPKIIFIKIGQCSNIINNSTSIEILVKYMFNVLQKQKCSFIYITHLLLFYYYILIYIHLFSFTIYGKTVWMCVLDTLWLKMENFRATTYHSINEENHRSLYILITQSFMSSFMPYQSPTSFIHNRKNAWHASVNEYSL